VTLPDVDTIDTYDGAKVNFGPVEDPTTDRDATGANRAYANVAMATRTLTRAWARVITSDTAPAVASHDAVWGAAAAVAPTISRSGLGEFAIAWPATVSDGIPTTSLGMETHAVNIRWAKSSPEGGPLPGSIYVPEARRVAANVVALRVYSLAGTLSDASGYTFLVEIG
jgi:hypothetical protein